MGKFNGKGYWAVILGASSGMGLASARKLAAEGMNLFLVHRDSRSQQARIDADFEGLRKFEVKVISHNANALSIEKQGELIESLANEMNDGEGIRVVLHSIAKGNLKPLAAFQDLDQLTSESKNAELTAQESSRVRESVERSSEMAPEGAIELSSDDFLQTIDAMAVSYYSWVKALLEKKLFTPGAVSLSLTSEGNEKAWRNYAAVSAAKASLESISRSMALEFAPHGLRANVIQAGVTDTPSLNAIPGSRELKTHALTRNPLQRLTRAEDVGNAVCLLAMDEAQWINGAIIPVDGGEHIT